MRIRAAVFIALFACLICTTDSALQAQVEESVVREEMPDISPPYPDVMVQFIGGNDALTEFLVNNMEYPEAAKKANIQGEVLVTFKVNADSSVEIVQVNAGADSLLADAARRVVQKTSKRWIPATYKGKPVATLCRLPILFELEESAPKSKQAEPPPPPKELPNYAPPEFIYAGLSLQDFIVKHLKYPESMRSKNLSVSIIMQFTVGDDGSVSNIFPKDSMSDLYQPFVEEAARVLRLTSLKWKPAMQNGAVQKAVLRLPFRFELD